MNKTTTSNLANDVIDVCFEVLRVPREKIVPEAKLVDDLDVDSLFIVQLGMALEDKFKIEVPEEEIPRLKTVQDIVDYVQQKVDSRSV